MKICVLGATGLVGRETLTLIERAWPNAALELFASRDQTMQHGGRELAVEAATRLEGSRTGGDLAFVALDDEHSARFVPRLLALGYHVVDKSNTYRMDPKVPLVVAGVNDDRVDENTRLVANPNCTTIPFALAVAPLLRRFGLRAATVSSYQAISGAGLGPLEEFLAASRDGYTRERGNHLLESFDPLAYPGNVVPHAGKTDETGFSGEERKLVDESRKILDLPNFSICAQCCRVPVAVGHYENVWITLERGATLEQVAATLAEADARFVHFLPGATGDGLSALSCVHDRDRALVGRLRVDPRDDSGRSFCLTVAADNLRLGAATNAVRIASRWIAAADPGLQAASAGFLGAASGS